MLLCRFVGGGFYVVCIATKHPSWIKRLVCPECKSKGEMRTILYGMPNEDFDFVKYAVGGCCIQSGGMDPDIECDVCGWVGFRND